MYSANKEMGSTDESYCLTRCGTPPPQRGGGSSLVPYPVGLVGAGYGMQSDVQGGLRGRWGEAWKKGMQTRRGPAITQTTATSWRLVSSPSESLTQPQFTEPRFLEDVDCDDAALEEMLYNAHRERVYHSVGQSSSSVSDRSGRPVVERTGRPVVERTGRLVVERCQELNTDHAQIRTLLDRQREQILADCQAEIKKHEFQANYNRRSFQKMSETIESQQEELHRAQAEELQRRDQQLLDVQFTAKL